LLLLPVVLLLQPAGLAVAVGVVMVEVERAAVGAAGCNSKR
jgi:hypothetical protein